MRSDWWQIRVGQHAPKLILGRPLQGSFDPTLAAPVVVEFWATWCGQCLQSIHHLNELAAQFSGTPLRFLWLTSEPEGKVQRFLLHHEIRGVVAIDRDSAFAKMYDVVLPTTVLIGRDGFIEGITHPTQVTESMLNDLLQGRPLRLPVTLLPNNIGSDRTLTGQKVGDDSRAAVRIAVTPVFGNSPSGLVNTESRLDTESATLRPLLSFAYSVSARRIILPTALEEGRYAVHAWVPPRRGDLMRPLLQQALAAAVDFHAAWEEHEVDVLILDGLPDKLRSKIVNVDNDLVTSDLRDGYLSANNATFEVLCDQIERATDRIVIAESPVAGRFGYELKWDASKPDSLTVALSREFGLTLKLDRRNIRTLVITTDHP